MYSSFYAILMEPMTLPVFCSNGQCKVSTPILILAFNRPNSTSLSLYEVYTNSDIFISCDGPRSLS